MARGRRYRRRLAAPEPPTSMSTARVSQQATGGGGADVAFTTCESILTRRCVHRIETQQRCQAKGGGGGGSDRVFHEGVCSATRTLASNCGSQTPRDKYLASAPPDPRPDDGGLLALYLCAGPCVQGSQN